MYTKLANLKNIMDLIIESLEPKNAVFLFKLLTLDLSPCLTKFILNIFVNAFNSQKNEDWKKSFVDQLLLSKYEVIVVNTFKHSLPDIRIDLLKFVYQVHLRLLSSKNTNTFKNFENMIKTCLLPDETFYCISSSNKSSKNISFNNTNNAFSFKKPELAKENQKIFEPKKEEPKKLETKKEEFKKIEPKKLEPKRDEPKKPEIKKIEQKKEEKPKPSNSGGGNKNFMALLSKFDTNKLFNELYISIS